MTPADIIDYVAGYLAGFKKPKRVWIKPELPKNATGKVLKRQLREMILAEAAAGPPT